jgi:hypothetical protein
VGLYLLATGRELVPPVAVVVVAAALAGSMLDHELFLLSNVLPAQEYLQLDFPCSVRTSFHCQCRTSIGRQADSKTKTSRRRNSKRRAQGARCIGAKMVKTNAVGDLYCGVGKICRGRAQDSWHADTLDEPKVGC